MAIYVFAESAKCIADAKKHGVLEEVQNLKEKVEKDQSYASWDKFLPHPYVKKNLGKSWRLVAHQSSYNEDILLTFVALFPRGNKEYEKDFIKNPSVYCNPLLPPKQEMDNYYKIRKAGPPPREKPDLTDEEHEFLHSSIPQIDATDGMIYESETWVQMIQQPSMQPRLSEIYKLILKLIDGQHADKSEVTDANAELIILYRYLPEHKILFLIGPMYRPTKQQKLELLKQYESMTTKGDDIYSKELLMKVSRRAYPALVFTESDKMWIDIETNTEGNIALSPEEIEILENIRLRNREHIFPLFINGRPGSGKTTILLYLFTDRVYTYLVKSTGASTKRPIYLTYSSKLVERARYIVTTILSTNPHLRVDGFDYQLKSKEVSIDSCFAEFQHYLLNLLPLNQRNHFNPEKRVDFKKFKLLFNNKYTKTSDMTMKHTTAEFAWHIIRTYIKGMRDDFGSYCDLDVYKELPAKQLTVLPETFEKVYTIVWEQWFKKLCENEGYWDDQDLARCVLDLPLEKLSQGTAIFCDEAQDFTRNELELILKLTIYSNRKIPSEVLKYLPFAFAGDPYQTLNPTGFDWNAVKSAFHEKIVQELDAFGYANLQFNFQELKLNYRSSKQIVGFCNFIQIIRGLLFEIKDLRPQKTYFMNDAPVVALFDIKNPVCQDALLKQEELVIILPCQEGEEEDFVNDDEFLQTLQRKSSISNRNFLSAMSAKGLEFSRVVLYKFGECCLNDYPELLKPLDDEDAVNDEREKSVSLEYFLNRLYVGASRPIRRLILVDTTEGIDSFWNNHLLTKLEDLINRYQKNTQYTWEADDCNFWQPGREETFSGDQDDPAAIAEQFMSVGVLEKDPYKLKLAEDNFIRANQKQKALLCKAIRCEIEGSIEEAGDTYLQLAEYAKALDCYWNASNYDKILNNNHFINSLKHRAAYFLNDNQNASNCESFLDFILTEMQGSNSYEIICDEKWSKVVIQNLIHAFSKLENYTNFSVVYSKLVKIEKNGLLIQDSYDIGLIAYRAKQYKEAVDRWDRMHIKPNTDDYKTAKADVLDFPENLEWLAKIGKNESILKIWQDHKNETISQQNANLIIESFIHQGDIASAIEMLRKYPDTNILETLIREEGQKSIDVLAKLYPILLKHNLDQEHWSEAIETYHAAKKIKTIYSQVLRILIINVASCKDFYNVTTIKNRDEIAAIIKKHVIDTAWENIVGFTAVGLAIERTTKIVYALEFYVRAFKNDKLPIPATNTEIQFAKDRWIKNLKRLADYYEKKQNRKFEKVLVDLDKWSKAWRIDVDKIPEYPTIDSTELSINEIEDDVTIDLSEETIEMIEVWAKSNKFAPIRIAERLDVSIENVEAVIRRMKK